MRASARRVTSRSFQIGVTAISEDIDIAARFCGAEAAMVRLAGFGAAIRSLRGFFSAFRNGTRDLALARQALYH